VSEAASARGSYDGSMHATSVLVVEDDRTVADVVQRYLENDGFNVHVAADGPAGLRAAVDGDADLVVLDIMLPGLDGMEVCRRLRATRDVPVIMLTARGQEPDRVRGLQLGADDYVVKPFSPRELVARVRSVLRRTRRADDEPRTVVSRDIVLEPAARRVVVRGQPVSLTAREFDLLAFLMRYPSRVFRREELLEDVWGYRFGDLSTVTVHVRRLREKIEVDPSNPCVIQTVWGVGYRFDPEPSEGPARGTA
jgi:two-component system response regulator ResD